MDVHDRSQRETAPPCRWCAGTAVEVVLDLGTQPPADLFPLATDPGPDRSWPLRMGACPQCGLAQLLEDPGVAEEPLGLEPQALTDQATAGVAALRAAGLLRSGLRFVEFDSPHGGSWRSLLADEGGDDRTDYDTAWDADLVVDVFGMMHEADQRAALRRRVARLADDGTLLLQFHSLASIVAQGQWNALRHGHLAYYSTRALTGMLAALGLSAYAAWTFELYGGTVLLAAGREPRDAGETLARLLAADDRDSMAAPLGVAGLEAAAADASGTLRSWLDEQQRAGRRVVGYAAASRTVPLLVRAGIGPDLLPAVADGAAGKRGRRLPGGAVPIIAADELRDRNDDIVLVFVPDLLDEVRRAHPEIEARGGRWAVSEPRPRLVDRLDA